MHLVHLRRNKSAQERAGDEIGYAVVAVFFELGNVANHQLTPITNALQLIQAAGSKYQKKKCSFYPLTLAWPTLCYKVNKKG